MKDALDQVVAYHVQTKHHFHAYARSLGYMDWHTQPDPFRRYIGAPVVELEQSPLDDSPLYESAFVEGRISPAYLSFSSISRLFLDSLAISAWKSAGGASWALRVNPSSGNLHPTEGYLVCGPVEGLCGAPMVCHYAPREHALEKRAEFPESTWTALMAEMPDSALLVGLTSIYWREAWKYGERAFRYCQHDLGHAIATISIAAAGLGWRATLLDDVGTQSLAMLLGVLNAAGPQAEHPECVLAVYPQNQICATHTLPHEILNDFHALDWQGRPNRPSPAHVEWPIIDAASFATSRPGLQMAHPLTIPESEGSINSSVDITYSAFPPDEKHPVALRHIIHQRRSAVAMDGRTSIPRHLFYRTLGKTLAIPGRFPFNTLPWRSRVHLALFVHRVQDMAPGLYVLNRWAGQQESLQAAMRPDFVWERPASCPTGLALYRLRPGNVRTLSQQLSCNQEIASDGCFTLGMIAEFEEPLANIGPWFYRRLFWECGMIGQVLYLEAEAAGLRGTGIGCFFDDPVHDVLGLAGLRYQSLYHFTVGGPVEDTRLTTLPAYPAR